MELLTKTGQVEQHLRNAILRGRWTAGQKLPAERDLQAQLGVGQRTVREALIRISEDGLIERRQGAGTFVSDKKKTGSIAILANIDSLTSNVGYYYRNLVECAQAYIKDAGFRPVLSVGHGNTPEEFASSVHLFDKSIVKDTVGVLSALDMGPLEQKLEKRDIPSVSIVAAKPTRKHCVVLDYEAMIARGVQLLQKKGFSEFALFYNEPPPEDMKGCEKINEVRKGLVEVGVDISRVQLVSVPWSNNLEQAYDVFKRFWKQPHHPQAVFFTDDGTCEVALQAMLELGIKVPEELALVTQANAGRTFHFPVSLMRVEFDPAEVLARGWEMLEKLVSGQTVDEPVVYIPPSVREGESLGKSTYL